MTEQTDYEVQSILESVEADREADFYREDPDELPLDEEADDDD